MIAESAKTSHTGGEEARSGVIFERTVQEEAVLVLFRALLTAEPACDVHEAKARAEAFARLCEEYRVDVLDCAKNWVLFSRDGHERTPAALRRWCEKLRDLRRAAPVQFGICPQCTAETAQEFAGHWLCPMCGEVPAPC